MFLVMDNTLYRCPEETKRKVNSKSKQQTTYYCLVISSVLNHCAVLLVTLASDRNKLALFYWARRANYLVLSISSKCVSIKALIVENNCSVGSVYCTAH